MESLLNIIRELLETQNYAQVPGLGRFYYQEVTARRSKKQNTITPPCRMLVFNDASSKNNQQFIEHFAEQEHCNLFNAATEVSSLVNHIKQALKTRGTYYLDCVGTLMASNDKTYFQPDVATVFCEDMYGLEVLTMEPLATRNSSLPKVHRPAPPVHGEQVTEESKRNWTIHLNKRKVGYTLGAVATLLVILCLSLPLTEKYHIGFASLHNIFYSTAVDSFNEKSGRNSDTVINSPVKQEPVVAVTKKVNKPMAPEVDVQPKGIISEEELIEKHKDLVDNGKLPSSETNTSAKEAEKAAAEKAAAEKAAAEKAAAEKAAAEKAAAEKAAAEAAAKAKAEAEARAKAEAAKKEAAALAAKEAAAKEAAALAAKEAAAKEAAAKEAAAAKAQGSYTIVLASAVSEKNADDYVERLKKNGFKDAKKYKKGTMVRVIYSSFASETEARNQLKKLRSNEAFEQAWVYEMK